MSNVLSKMPNIAIPRTKFKQEFNHATTFEHGKLIPIDCFEILPGDNISLTISSLIRMSTPLVPLFGNITAYLHAFFVPMRLIWSDAEKFYGDPSNHNTVSSITPVDPETVLIPNWKPDNIDFGASDYIKSVASYLGKPFIYPNQIDSVDIFISCLKERGYYVLWNEYFRPSNLILPCLVDLSSGTDLTYVGSDYEGHKLDFYHPVLPVCKKYDYFTACTLSPQFGSSVTLPLGTSAPVITGNVDNTSFYPSNPSDLVFINKTNMNNYTSSHGLFVYSNGKLAADASSFSGSLDSYALPKNLIADLSEATAASINNIRYAFQVQKYLERSNYGSRYFEILNAHYGVQSPDGRLQRPDRLGYHSFFININQVLATSTSDDGAGATSRVGQTGAVSVTGDKVHLFSGAFTEPGYLYVLVDTKYDRSYSGGLLREDKRKTRFEFYSPEFAHLGDQAIYKNEIALYDIYSTSTPSFFDDKKIFGYQEHWAEYRYRKDRVSGLLNPTTTAQAGVSSLDFWTLADVFDAVNTTPVSLSLNNDFLFEDRDSLARVLVTGVNGPDYVADFHFEYIVTRELPLYSIPGLIDHFGAL